MKRVAAFLVAALMGTFLTVAVWRVIHHVSVGDVCASCHSMKFASEEYQKSTHYRSRSGVKAGCVDCHIPAGLWRVLVFKQLAKDRYIEMINPIKTEAEWEKRRPALAKKVRERLLKHSSDTCIGCHKEEAMVPTKDRGKKAHQDMKKTGETCIDCHFNIVHAVVPWDGKPRVRVGDDMLDL